MRDQSQEKTDPWVPVQNGDQGRPARFEQTESEGAEKTDRLMVGLRVIDTGPPRMESPARSGGMEEKTFQKLEVIRRRSEFAALHKLGKRFYSGHFTLVVKKNALGHRRLGLTISKKVGKSVQRNRMKRLLREFFRLNKDRFPASHDLWFIVRKDFSKSRYADLCREMDKLLGERLATLK